MIEKWPAEIMARLQRDADEIGRLRAELAAATDDYSLTARLSAALTREANLRAELAAVVERAQKREHSLSSSVATLGNENARLRAELDAALDAVATEKTLREHETRRANDNYAQLTKHWLKEGKLRELLTEIVEYTGYADHALADEYVVARIEEEIRGE